MQYINLSAEKSFKKRLRHETMRHRPPFSAPVSKTKQRYAVQAKRAWRTIRLQPLYNAAGRGGVMLLWLADMTLCCRNLSYFPSFCFTFAGFCAKINLRRKSNINIVTVCVFVNLAKTQALLLHTVIVWKRFASRQRSHVFFGRGLRAALFLFLWL